MIWPMARRQTLVQLTDDLLALLDERAARTGRSRSEIIRSAIERELAAEREAAIDAAIVEGYTRLPPPKRDPWAEASAKRSVADEPW
jgi:Arc/MetJ-type ribon-helix-helix transcriptional regulator